MKDLQVFDNPEFGSLTVIEKDGEPWFMAKDVASILEYSEASAMTRRLDDDEKTTIPWKQRDSNYQTNKIIISEKGVVSVISRCRTNVSADVVSWVLSLLKNQNYVPVVIRDEFISLNTIEQLLQCKLQRQYKVGIFRIDGYDIKNNIAYEIDEQGHIGKEKEDAARERFIKNALGCKFVRIRL